MYSKKQIKTIQAAINGAQEVIGLVGRGDDGTFAEEEVSNIFYALNSAWLVLLTKIEEEDRPDV